MYEHKNELTEGFTKKYGIKQLVYYEVYGEILDAIQREKRVKKWNRIWKIRLIRTQNPEWNDLSKDGLW
jgi:putative endonuclease